MTSFTPLQQSRLTAFFLIFAFHCSNRPQGRIAIRPNPLLAGFFYYSRAKEVILADPIGVSIPFQRGFFITMITTTVKFQLRDNIDGLNPLLAGFFYYGTEKECLTLSDIVSIPFQRGFFITLLRVLDFVTFKAFCLNPLLAGFFYYVEKDFTDIYFLLGSQSPFSGVFLLQNITLGIYTE